MVFSVKLHLGLIHRPLTLDPYPLSLIPYLLSLIPYPLSLTLVPYPLALFLSMNLGEGCCYCHCCCCHCCCCHCCCCCCRHCRHRRHRRRCCCKLLLMFFFILKCVCLAYTVFPLLGYCLAVLSPGFAVFARIALHVYLKEHQS